MDDFIIFNDLNFIHDKNIVRDGIYLVIVSILDHMSLIKYTNVRIKLEHGKQEFHQYSCYYHHEIFCYTYKYIYITNK